MSYEPQSSQNPPAFTATSQPAKNSVLAIWSLALGILALTCFSLFSAIPGVICGHKALGEIKRSGGALGGQGLAIAGLITGYVSILLSLVMIPMMLAIAIPNFVKARNTAQANLCRQNLQMLATAKEMWALELKKQPTATPTMDNLQRYLSRTLTCPAGGTYSINQVDQAPTCSIPGHELRLQPGSVR